VMWMPAMVCEKQVGDHSAFKRNIWVVTETDLSMVGSMY
jgi:hypothetical protein